MRSKEEILSKFNWSSEYPNYMAENNIHEAMDINSREVAIAFAEWMEKYGWWHDPFEVNGDSENVIPVWSNDPAEPQELTTDQLYNLFLSQYNKEGQ